MNAILGQVVPCISDEEHARRRDAINFARGSVRFEGVVLSDIVEAINTRFIDGEISLDEHGAEIRAALTPRQPRAR